jgi:hypothetical protein
MTTPSPLHTAISPVALSYTASLRGHTPRKPGEAFAYAMFNCDNPDFLTCLAASNPEGRFFGVVSSETVRSSAQMEALARDVGNVTFLAGPITELLKKCESGTSPLPPLTYLCCDETTNPLSPSERNAMFALAEKCLQPGGLLQTSYRPYASEDGALRFLTREFRPEISADKAKDLLLDLKQLGGKYLSKHPDVASRLNAAIAKGEPDSFLGSYGDAPTSSGSFNTLVALRPRGFVYAGDSQIASNYVELSLPEDAQNLIVTLHNHVLYEPIKDYALNREIRSDIWCRQPAAQSNDLGELFGRFTYGISMPREAVPTSFKAEGKTIPLDSPLYARLIDLMALMPVTIGDFLSHPSGKDENPVDVVGALQILIACGIAQPMRGVYEAKHTSDMSHPRLVGSFNRYLGKTSVTGGNLWVASPVVGDPVAITARDALVMQAVERAGLANSVSALMPELERLAQNPKQAAQVMDSTQPTPELARDMIQDVLSKSIVKWYAYGVLQATKEAA